MTHIRKWSLSNFEISPNQGNEVGHRFSLKGWCCVRAMAYAVLGLSSQQRGESRWLKRHMIKEGNFIPCDYKIIPSQAPD